MVDECHEGDIWTIKAHWKCGPCFSKGKSEAIFNNDHEFEDHLGRFCHICAKEFTSFDSWQRHHSNDHIKTAMNASVSGKKTKFFYCHHCLFVCHKKPEFATHMNAHNVYKCLGCDKGFVGLKLFAKHAKTCNPSWQKMVSASVIYDCQTCSLLAKSLKELLVHFLRCAPKIKDEAELVGVEEDVIKDAIMRSIANFDKSKSPTEVIMIRAPQSSILRPKATLAKESGFKIMGNGQVKMVVGSDEAKDGTGTKRRRLITPKILDTGKTSLNEALSMIGPKESEPPEKTKKQDNGLQISSVTSLLDSVFDAPTDEVIGKIVEASVKRPDILEKIIQSNLPSIQTRLFNKNSRGCSVRLERTKVPPNSVANVTPVTIPENFLPFGLNDFEALDEQKSAELPVKNVYTEHDSRVHYFSIRHGILGWKRGHWEKKPPPAPAPAPVPPARNTVKEPLMIYMHSYIPNRVTEIEMLTQNRRK